MVQDWQLALAIFASILIGKVDWSPSELAARDSRGKFDRGEPTTGHAFIGLGDSFDDDRRRVRLP